jgi:hypothetical protein
LDSPFLEIDLRKNIAFGKWNLETLRVSAGYDFKNLEIPKKPTP